MQPPDLSQGSFLGGFLITLHLIAWLELGEILEAHAALGTLSHLRDVFLDVLEGRQHAWDHFSKLS